MVTVLRRVRKNVTIIVDMKDGIVKVMVDGFEASRAEFVFDHTQIMVTDVGTNKKYTNSGYGRLLFDVLKLISEQKKMPLILWSLDNAISFYEAVGMLHLNDPEIQNKVILGNITKRQCTRKGCENIWKEKIDNDDFIWIPQSLYRRKPIIYL